jgi:UDP-N-acetylmuramate--alanine ligase
VLFAKAQRVHFIGIGGIGMSGIAEIVLNLGYAVSGSDLRRTVITSRLESLGVVLYEGHAAANVVGSGVVVVSSAIDERNPEVAEARARKIPVIQRAEMLSELMRLKYGIAIAGMHGKTTTTSMVASVLAAGGLDPTIVVGGRVNALGSNARLGKSHYLVAEADESDRSFLKLAPILAVVTNLDREHMDCYRDMADVEDAFVEFMNRVPFYGANVVCADDPLLAKALPRVRRRVFTYGVSLHADYIVRSLPADGEARSRFEVVTGQGILGPFELHVPGMHNVLNATAAVAIATQLDLSEPSIVEGLKSFRGVERRFELKGKVDGIAVVDDYGHHPTEIRATLRAARECGYPHIHVLFQPHRYSRTRDMMEEFAHSFDDAASVEMLDIYAASEKPIPGIDTPALIERIGRQTIRYAPSTEQAIESILGRAASGDLVLTLGAGSVSQLAPLILDQLQQRERLRQHRPAQG